MNNKKILSIYYKHKKGGFTKRLYQAYMAIAMSGNELTYISSERLPVDHKNIKPLIIEMKSKEGTALFWPEFFLRSMMTSRKMASEGKIDGYFVFSFVYSALLILASFGTSVKTIVFVRADEIETSRNRSLAWLRMSIHRFLEWISMHNAAQVVTNNKSFRDKLHRRNPNCRDADYLPNNIPSHAYYDEDFELDDTKPNVCLVTSAVLNDIKNHLHVLQALKDVKARNWVYKIIGDDVENTGYGKQLSDYVEQHGLHEHVEFMGWRENSGEIIRHCDLFVFPSRSEGSPNSLLEAMGTGIPCLASNIPEIREILDQDELTFPLSNPCCST